MGLAGNVGHSLAAQVAENKHSMYVVELSSFQLDGMYEAKADIAILTNITPDHLDRYDYKFENYVDSKFRVLQNMTQEDLYIYSGDCPNIANKLKTFELSTEACAFTYDNKKSCTALMNGDDVVINYGNRHFSISKDRISIKGRHNVYNAMAASIACMKLGLGDEQLISALESFPQVEHRLETVCVKNGVTYINDSKATNVDSAWYALDSMTKPVVWIAGGTDKGNDYSVLNDLVRSKVKVLVCMGKDNRKLIDSFSSICKVESTDNLADAIAVCERYAENGDVVLLSPCCASFDLFKNYENRGELFKEAVRNL